MARNDERERGEPRWGFGANRYTAGRHDRWRDAREDIDRGGDVFGPAWRDDRSDVRRHEMLERQGVRQGGGFRGRGPRNYVRSDERIAEDVHWTLTEAADVDATDIDVTVTNGEAHLRGAVLTRDERSRAEELVRYVTGVRHVINELEVRRPDVRRRF